MSYPQIFVTPSLPVLVLEVTTGSAQAEPACPQPKRQLQHRQHLDTTFPLSYFPP